MTPIAALGRQHYEIASKFQPTAMQPASVTERDRKWLQCSSCRMV